MCVGVGLGVCVCARLCVVRRLLKLLKLTVSPWFSAVFLHGKWCGLHSVRNSLYHLPNQTGQSHRAYSLRRPTFYSHSLWHTQNGQTRRERGRGGWRKSGGLENSEVLVYLISMSLANTFCNLTGTNIVLVCQKLITRKCSMARSESFIFHLSSYWQKCFFPPSMKSIRWERRNDERTAFC